MTTIDDACHRVDHALAALRAGAPVLLVDDGGGDGACHAALVLAADRVTAQNVAFTVRHSSGVVCVALDGARLDELDLPLMAPSPAGREFAVSVDVRHGTTTGISAADRAATVRALANPLVGPADLLRPGHIFPLRCRPGGVLERLGLAEAARDLALLAEFYPAAALADLVDEGGDLASWPFVLDFADRHELPLLTIFDVFTQRAVTGPIVIPAYDSALVSPYGRFTVQAFDTAIPGLEVKALVRGNVAGRSAVVEVHRECPLGQAFEAEGCNCAADLRAALHTVGSSEAGVLVYLSGSAARQADHAAGRPVALTSRMTDQMIPLVATAVLRSLGSSRSNPVPATAA